MSGLALRPPEQVMRLDRLGALHQCRLSFMRTLTRRMAAEGWRFSRPMFEMDARGVGRAVYKVETGARVYSMVAFAHDLPDEDRSDRVIAEAWDATFTLFDGTPDAADLARLEANVPRQEAGRISERELALSRANRSTRLWTHVVAALASGRQPDPAELARVGYLMRTTAVYGSGKFGAADYATICVRPEFSAPFQVEMLLVYLIRSFVRDLVNHMARARGGAQAAALAPDLARALGIGNATGLGMAPFIVNHPVLFNNWIAARETALARVCARQTASAAERTMFRDLFARFEEVLESWRSDHPVQRAKLADLRADYAAARAVVAGPLLEGAEPWARLMAWADGALSLEGQECLASLILEPFGALVDDLTADMADPGEGTFRLNGSMTIGAARAQLAQVFGWAEARDWDAPEEVARLWYVSAEKLEPRLAERADEPLEPYEQPLAPGREAARAARDLALWADEETLAAFLLAHPEHRRILRRVQMALEAPYGEIRDNTIHAEMLPLDMLRAKLSFFGATHFDPRSDRWLRIRMYPGAPYPEELTHENCDFWVYPERPA
ncbi:MAG: hypothetical protein OIF48_19860 [Silicimonas sp.]|nr:hypothetical protein [Silicimonas sp.]